ncbi:hypothetical protein O0L34_g5367 [Tuta absoluta]|nr:hypothetical protein O0L34_g5367 [Tuta absoluta]
MKNMRISGLSDAVVTAFKLNEISRTISMSMISNLKVTADIILRLDDEIKVYTGQIQLLSGVKTICRYNFDIETDIHGMEHLCIGKERTKCKCLGNPRFVLDEVLSRALVQNPELQAKLLALELINSRKKLVTKIAELAIPKLFEKHRKKCRVS